MVGVAARTLHAGGRLGQRGHHSIVVVVLASHRRRVSIIGRGRRRFPPQPRKDAGPVWLKEAEEGDRAGRARDVVLRHRPAVHLSG